MARAWQTRPSQLLAEDDDVLAFLLDEALALRLESPRPAPSQLPPGMTYEDPRDIPRPGPVAPGPAAAILAEGAHA